MSEQFLLALWRSFKLSREIEPLVCRLWGSLPQTLRHGALASVDWGRLGTEIADWLAGSIYPPTQSKAVVPLTSVLVYRTVNEKKGVLSRSRYGQIASECELSMEEVREAVLDLFCKGARMM